MTANDHDGCVEAWLLRQAPGPSPDRVLVLLELALAALWGRCQLRLGEVTLMAIADRVLHEGRGRFPCLGHLTLGATGILLDGLRSRSREASIEEVQGASRFLLAEFLRVVGRLTAEVLTPALHAELSAVTLPAAEAKTDMGSS